MSVVRPILPSPTRASRRGRVHLCVLGCVTILAVFVTGATAAVAADDQESGYRVEPAEDGGGWNVLEGDELVAGYRFDSNGKPIIFPLHSPSGLALTRGYPMDEGGAQERDDHPHQRSLWLTHGEINGLDFWVESGRDNRGQIRHRSGSAKADGETAVLVTSNDWVSPDEERVLTDKRRFAFRTVEGRRVLDCDFVLTASDGDVHFGDTKEGTFGIRVAGTMKVDADPGGQITNAEGKTDKEAWGEPSSWVDYTGPVAEETAGITVHYHPSSFDYPCRWHVRTYGLFAANPFGVYHFVGGDKTDGYMLAEGESLRMNFRLVLHDGPFDADEAEADFEAYSNEARPTNF